MCMGNRDRQSDEYRTCLRKLLLYAVAVMTGAGLLCGCGGTQSGFESAGTAAESDMMQSGSSASDAADGDSGSGSETDAVWGSQNEQEEEEEEPEEHHLWITETETTSVPPFEVIRKADSFEGITPDRFGTAGLLLIPDVGINVRLFGGSDESDRYNQRGVDMEDSAALLNFGGTDVIGDHSNQGFSAIRGSVIGETRAYIVQEDHSYREYICAGILDGTNDDHHLYGSDGLDYMHAVSDRYDLVMYTCLENWEHIEIVLWKDVDAAVQSEYHFGG